MLSSSVVLVKKESPENELQQTINNYLQQTIKENEIPSLAVGVVKDEKILFEGYYGKRMQKEIIPLMKIQFSESILPQN